MNQTKNMPAGIKKVIRDLKRVDAGDRPVSFWFLNHHLDPDEIRRQVRAMAEKGLGGFMFHGREGLRVEYLGHEWETAFRAALDEAKRLGMHVWLYDEMHFPSGVAGGKLLEKYPGRVMLTLVPFVERKVPALQTINLSFNIAPKYVLASRADKPGRTLDLGHQVRDGRLTWRNTTGGPAWLLVLAEHRCAPGPDNKAPFLCPDYLDAEVMREFIHMTHAWYAKRFGPDFGRTIKGIFTDNGCAHFGHIRRGVPWSRELEKRYLSVTGRTIQDALPALLLEVPGWREHRIRFWRFFGHEFIRTFVGAVNDYCRKKKIFSTGHYCVEEGMGEHVRQIGDYFEVMRNQTLNAVDQLGPYKTGASLFGYTVGEHLTAGIKNTSSAALWYNSPRVMCESFGLAGQDNWGLNLAELRRITGHLLALGVDLFVPHGLYYSIAGPRKWESLPDHLHNSFWHYYREWSDWTARLCQLSAGGQSTANVGVLYPASTLQVHMELGAGRKNIESDLNMADGWSANWLKAACCTGSVSDRGRVVDKVTLAYTGILDELTHNRVAFEVLPEDILQTGNVAGTKTLNLPARGGRQIVTLKLLILPETLVLEKASLKKLNSFARDGGCVVCLNKIPNLAYDPVSGRLTHITPPFLNGHYRLIKTSDKKPFCAELITLIHEQAPQLLRISGKGPDVVARTWEKSGCRFYFVHNSSSHPAAGLRMELSEPEAPLEIDLDNPRLESLPWMRNGKDWNLAFDLPPAASRLFVVPADNHERIIPTDNIVTQKKHVAPVKEVNMWLDLPDEWGCRPAGDNIIPLLSSHVFTRGALEIHRYDFILRDSLKNLRCLLDLEMSRKELLRRRHGDGLKVTLNGHVLGPFVPGSYLDAWIFEATTGSATQKGVNRLEIEMNGNWKLWTPYLIGPFYVRRGPDRDTLTHMPKRISLGDWRKQGWVYYSGTINYRNTITLPEKAKGRALLLDMGAVADGAEIRLNGRLIGRRILPPWRYELPPTNKKRLLLEVRVFNTMSNVFCPPGLPSGWLGPKARLGWKLEKTD
ncbi:hypothetical protein ACFLQL_02470 [Verrucomicrobiota bacterium]